MGKQSPEKLSDKRIHHQPANERATTGRFAESRTEEKDIMVKVVVNLINRNN